MEDGCSAVILGKWASLILRGYFAEAERCTQ